MIIAGASVGETKMWAAARENGDFFAFAVGITGKLVETGKLRWATYRFRRFDPYDRHNLLILI